jgi:hypothetical protein
MGVTMLAQSIPKHGRAKSYHRRGLWAIKKKNGGKVGPLRHNEEGRSPWGFIPSGPR